jgi:uncharacterized protein YciI
MTTIRGLLLLGSLALLPLRAGQAGADAAKTEPKYEMTTYVVGLLRKGPRWTAADTPEVRRIQQGHRANIRKMAEAGKLIVAGPFTDNGDLRGMFVFRVSSVQEAQALAAADPAVKAARLVVELHPWFAAKGLQVNVPK